MTTPHPNLTGAEIHEPKGIDSAAVDQLYSATGGGSGIFQKIKVANIDATSVKNVNKIYLNVEFDDISTAQSVWVVAPLAGTVTGIKSVIGGPLASVNAALTFEIGGTLITGSGITVAFSGSAGGTVDSSTPTAANAVTAGQAIECITDGGSTNIVKCVLTIEITLS
tara:strand:+ start:7849 stop:8349 length:501 start_codon:yes stop_codon:yes gene_type:complete